MGVRTCRVVGRLLAFGLSVVVIGLCCQSTVMADVGLSLRVNLWETVPSDDPVYEDLSKLADLGIIRLPLAHRLAFSPAMTSQTSSIVPTGTEVEVRGDRAVVW